MSLRVSLRPTQRKRKRDDGKDDEIDDSPFSPIANEPDSEEEEYGKYDDYEGDMFDEAVFADYSKLQLKKDHFNRPCWVAPNLHIFLESFSPLYPTAYEFLVAIAEPLSRPKLIHEYTITDTSLYSAVSVGLTTESIIRRLDILSKTMLPKAVIEFITERTAAFGKVKLVLRRNRYYLEATDAKVLQELLMDERIQEAREEELEEGLSYDESGLLKGKAQAADESAFLPSADVEGEEGGTRREEEKRIQQRHYESNRRFVEKSEQLARMIADEEELAREEGDEGDQKSNEEQEEDLSVLQKSQGQEADEKFPKEKEQRQSGQDKKAATTIEVHSFEVKSFAVEKVRKACLELRKPALEEYDFRGDTINETIDIELRPTTSVRPYQEKSLSMLLEIATNGLSTQI